MSDQIAKLIVMMSIKDESIKDCVDVVIRRIQARREQAAAEAADRFRLKHESYAVAHLAFMEMHLALLTAAETFVALGHDAEIVLSNNITETQIILKIGRRRCIFSLWLTEAAVKAIFCGEGFKTWHMAWDPPRTLAHQAHYQSTATLVKAACAFVVGLVTEPDPQLVRP